MTPPGYIDISYQVGITPDAQLTVEVVVEGSIRARETIDNKPLSRARSAYVAWAILSRRLNELDPGSSKKTLALLPMSVQRDINAMKGKP